jgi:membrane protein YdbS with pleckstrin-like domain
MILTGTTLRKSPFVFLKRLVIVEFFFAFLPFIATWLFDLDSAYENTGLAANLSFPLLAVILVTSLQVFIVAAAFLSWYLPAYTFGERAIIHRRANLVEDRRLARLQDIHAIDHHLGPLGRRLGYGDVLLETRQQDELRIREIPDPAHYGALLDSQVRQLAELPESVTPTADLDAPVDLADLVSGGENQVVEFKASLVWDYHQQRANKGLYKPVFKNIVAFLNSGGGRLLIGVGDDGQILGLEPDLGTLPKANVDGFENVFNQAFNSMIGVEYRRFVSVSFPLAEGQAICLVEVRPADEPVYLRLKGDEQFYIRAGNNASPLPVSKAVRYIQAHFEGP